MKVVLLIVLLTISNLTFADSYTEGLDLSDEDRRMLNDYSSETYNQQALDELCNDSDPNAPKYGDPDYKEEWIGETSLSDACKGSSVKTWGIDEQAISAISKAYSQFALVGSLGGVGGQTTNAEMAAKTNTQATGKQGMPLLKIRKARISITVRLLELPLSRLQDINKTNIKKYLQEVPTSAENLQTDSLIKIKKNYREKAKNQEINSIAWSGTSVCYIHQMTAGGAAVDLKIGLKFTAAAVLGVYNGMAAANHRNLADQLNTVIQKCLRMVIVIPSPKPIVFATSQKT